MKKWLTIPLIFFFSFGLTGCSSTPMHDAGQTVNTVTAHAHSNASE